MRQVYTLSRWHFEASHCKWEVAKADYIKQAASWSLMEGAAGFVACRSNDQDDCFKDRSLALFHKVDGAESEEMSADRCCRSCKTPLLFNDSNVGAYWRRKRADEVLNKLITEIRGKRVDDCVKLKNEPVEQMDDLDSQLSRHADSSFHKTMRTSYLGNCDTRAPSVERNENMCRNELDSLSSRGELHCHEEETHSVLHSGIVKEEKNEYLSTELNTSQDLETPWIPRCQQGYHFVKEEVDIKMDIYDECLEEQVNDQMIDNDTIREFSIPELVSNKKDGGTRIKTEPNTDLDTIQNDFMECQQVDFKNLTASCTDGTSSHYCEYDTSNAEASSVVSMESLSVPALSRLSVKTNTFLPESHTEKTCDERITEKDEHCTCKVLLKQKENLDYEESLVEQRDCIRTQISNLSYRFSDVVRRTKLLEENVMLKPQLEEKICDIRNRITKLNEILCFEGNLNSGAHCLKCKTLKRPGEPKFGSLHPFKKPALEASFCEPNETEGHTQMYGSAMSINSNVEEECKGKQNSSLMVLSSLENCSLDCQHKRKTNDDDSINDQGCMDLNKNKISQRKESKESRKGHVDTRSGSTVDGESLRNDAHMNWCKLCNVFAQSIIDYVHHLGSSEHLQRKKINDDSWLRMLPQTKKRHPLQEESHESYGVEFLDSATVFFCNLCKVLIWDKEEVMLHPRSPLHVQNFKDFVSENDLSSSGFHQRKMSAFLKHCEGREADNNGKQTESNERSESCRVSASHTFTDVVKSPCQENYCIPEIEVPHTTKINPTLCGSQNSKSSTVVTSTNLSKNNTIDIPVTLTDGNECNGTYESIKETPFFPANKTDSSSGSTTKSTPIIASKLRSTEGEFNKNSVFLRKPLTVKTTENITDTLMNEDDRFTQPRVAISDLEDLIEAAKTVEGETSQNEKISALTHQEEGTSITTDSIRVNRRGRNCIAPNDSLSISKSSKRKLKSKTRASKRKLKSKTRASKRKLKSKTRASKRKLKSKTRAKDKLKSLKTAYNKIGSPVTLEKSESKPATSLEIIKPLGSALSAVNFKDEIKRHSISDDTDTQSGTASKSPGIREKSSEITPLQPNDIQVEQTKNATESSGLSPRNVNRVKSRDNLSKIPKYSACVIDVAKEKLIDKDKHASVKMTMISNDSAIIDSEDLIEAPKTVEGETFQNEKISALTHQEEGSSITTDSIIVDRRGRNCIAPNDSLSISKSSKRKLKSKTHAKDKLKSLKTAYNNKIGSPVTLEKSENEPATSPEIIKPLGSALSAVNFKDEIKRLSISDDTDTQSGTASKSSGIREKSSEITPLQPNDIQVEQTKNATESSGLSPRNVNRVKSRDNLSKIPKYSACVIDVAKEKLIDKDKHASVKMTMISNDSAIIDSEDLIEAPKTVEGETSQNEKISALTHQEEGSSITTDSIIVNRRGRNCIAPNDSLSISKSSKRKLKSKTHAKDKLKSLKTAYNNKIGSPVTLEKSENEPATSPEIIKPLGSALSAVNFKDEIKRLSISDDTDTQSGTASKSSGIREKSSEITPLQPNDIQVEQTKNATESSGLSPRNVNRVKSRDNLSKIPKYSACVIDVAKEKVTDKDKHASVKTTMISNDSERKPKNSVKFENVLNYDEFQNFNNKVKNEVCSVGKKKGVKTNTIKRKNISLPKRKPEILKNVKSKLSYSVSCDVSSNFGKTPSSSVETKNLVEPNTASNSKCEATDSLSIGTKALMKSDETSAAKALKVNSAMDIHDAKGDSSMAPQTTTSFVNAEMISQFIKCQREKSVYFSDDALTPKRAIGAPLGICKLDNTLAMTSQNQSSAVDDTKKLSKTDTAPDILTANEIKGCHLGAVNTLSTDAGDESTSLSCNESKTVLKHNASSAETINTHGSATKIKSRESISQPATPTILAAKSDSSISESMTTSSSAKSKISLNDYWKQKGTCIRKIKENTSTATSSAQNSSDHSFMKADRISEHTEHDWICIRSGGESSQVVLPDANLMASRPDSEQVSQHTVNLLADLDSRKTHIAFASEASKAKVGQAFTRDLKNHTEKSNKQGTSISKPQPEVKINNFLKTFPGSTRFRSRKKAWKSSNVLLIGDKRLESIAYKPSLRSAKKIICIPHLQLPEALAIIKKELKAVNFDAVFLMVGHADITVQIQDEKCKACGCSTPFEYLKVKPENFQPFLDMVSQVNSILKSLFPKVYILWGSLYPINMHDYLSKATVHRNFSNIHKCGSDICHYISTNNLALQSVNHVYVEFNGTFTKFMEKYDMPHVDFCKFLRNKKKLCSDFHLYLSDGIHLNNGKLTICLADSIRNAITLSLLWMQTKIC